MGQNSVTFVELVPMQHSMTLFDRPVPLGGGTDGCWDR